MNWLRRKKDEPQQTGPQVVLLVEGMHCTSCGLLIDDELEDVPGVRSASTDFRSGHATVTLQSVDVDADELVAAVQRAGDYRASIVG